MNPHPDAPRPLRPLRPLRRLALALAAAAFTVASSGCSALWSGFERDTLEPGLRSPLSPRDVGLDAERVAIRSGDRTLDAYVARAADRCPGPPAAVLLFHGRNETAPDWYDVQRLLQERCVTSMVFDYTGHGRSSPGGSIARLNEDAAAAARDFVARFPGPGRRCALGFSMGAALALQATAVAKVPLDCVVLVGPFASLKDMAVRTGTSRATALLLSDAWNNVRAAAALEAPMLWVHSEDDEIVPIEAGRAVFDAKPAPRFESVVRGLDHNAIHRQRPAAIWDPVLRFVRDGAP